MTAYIVRRLLSTLAVLLSISILTFLIFQVIPNGDPALRIAGRTATPQTIALIRKQWGLTQPLPVQYLKMMEQIFTGKVISYTQNVNVVDEFWHGLPATLSLAIGASILWLLMGIALGLISGVFPGRIADRVATTVSLLGVSTPVFFLGAILLEGLSYDLGWFPDGGFVSLTANPIQWAYHLVLPWFTLALIAMGMYARLMATEVADQMHLGYVRTARAKGLSEWRVVFGHVLRNALMPLVALWGLDFAITIGTGAILVDSVFNLHGIGEFAAQATLSLDVPPIMVIVMFGAFAVVTISAVSDIVHALLDPRVKLVS